VVIELASNWYVGCVIFQPGTRLRLRPLRPILATTLLLGAPGCGDDDDGDDESAASLGDSESSTAGGSESEGESESDSESTGPAASEWFAHDIDIDVVEINQGVAIPIAVAGAWVDEAARNAPIIANRDTLLRVFWTLGPSYEPREILARLTLQSAAFGEIVREQILDIETGSHAGSLDRTFSFGIQAELMQPDLTFSVSLWEVDPSFAVLPAPELLPISPRDGAQAPVAVQDGPMAIEVVLVPHEAQWEGCSTQVPIDEVRDGLEDLLFMSNPTQRVELSVRPTPIIVTEQPADWYALHPGLQSARVADAADPNVYYYGLLDPCATDLEGFGGAAWGIVSDEKEADFQRIAAGLYLSNNPRFPEGLQFTYYTFVHEIGHLQGLKHVFCAAGDAANTDPTYPHDDGVIGVWGFGIRDFELHNPTVSRDYMTYCYDESWVSDWTWAKTFTRIRTLTSWDVEAPSPDASEPGTLLIGMFGRGGERWYTLPGTLPAAALASERVPVRTHVDGVTIDSRATWHRAPHGDTEILTVQLDADARVPEWLDTPRGVLQPRLAD
jgi:hypothetical protein